MATQATTTRRAFFLAGAGALASTAALAVPVAKVPTIEDWLNSADPEQAAQWHLMKAAEALNKIKPGMWYTHVNTDACVMVAHRRTDRLGRTGVVHQF